MRHASLRLPTKIFRRNSNKEKERFYAMYLRMPQTPAYMIKSIEAEDDNDDIRSIETSSTTATVDDNPGTGRVLDTYFYQPAGRRIERLALRFTIAYLHPWRISEFLSTLDIYGWLERKVTLSRALRIFDRERSRGPTAVAGLKSLVRQAQ